MEIQENYSLKDHNSFQVNAKARYFAKASHLEDLIELLQFSQQRKLPFLVLGGGSNILFTQDYEGIVIALELRGIHEEKQNEDYVLVHAHSGENWHQFVQYCIQKNYGGLENLSLIPGNVGTCPIQNIGAYGVEIKDHFHSCVVLNTETLLTETLNLEDCHFGYRDSIFKNSAKGKYIILSVCFKLSTQNHILRQNYGAISQQLAADGIRNPNISDIANAVIKIRQSKLPNPKEIGNAGSFFKNPIVPKEQYLALEKQHPNLPHYPAGDQIKIPAGWLIEQSGWKGKVIGNVGCHSLQALVIINATGKATGKEIYDFSSLIIDSVHHQFGITLEREVNIL